VNFHQCKKMSSSSRQKIRKTKKTPSPSSATISLKGIPCDIIHIVLDFCSLPSFINTACVSPWFKSVRDEIAEKQRGCSPSGLVHFYLLRCVLNISFEDSQVICSHLAQGEGQWVKYGDNGEMSIISSLVDFFFDELLLTDMHDSITQATFDLGGLALNCSTVLRDPHMCFSSGSYQKESREVLKYRDELIVADGIDVHSGICARCGSDKQVFFSADIPTAKGNLCGRCLDKTIFTRFKLQMKHSGACFYTWDEVKGPYEIPLDLKGTRGTRIGIFYSNGAQNSAFGLEFWADPVLVAIPGSAQSFLRSSDSKEDPPNIWKIVGE
jgi:hypothetical protein